MKDKDGYTAAFWAASKGKDACLKLVVDAKADLDVKQNYGWTVVIAGAYSVGGEHICLKVLSSIRRLTLL